MTKKNKKIIIILSAVLAVCLIFTGLTFSKSVTGKLFGGMDTAGGDPLSTVVESEFKSDYPLVQTQQENVFYETYPDGKIKYFKFADDEFVEITNVRTKKITVTCSYQKVPITLYYLEDTDVGTIGYGLFDSKQDTDVKTFSYIFARIMDCPASYRDSARTNYILLLDMDAEDSYKVNKTYSDIYSFDMSSGTASLIVSSRDRTVQEDATQNESWTIFTDESVNNMSKYDWFASTRYHDTNAEKILYDFMSVESSRSVRKASSTEFTNSPSYNIWEKDGSVYCFADSDDGFNLVKDGKKDSPLKKFSGSFSDYAVGSHFILDPSSMEFTDIYTGETVSVKKARLSSLSGFIASPNGKNFIVFCGGDKQAMVIYKTEDNKANIISDSGIFDDGICNYCFISNSTVLVSDFAEDGTAVNRIVKI